MKIFSNTQYSVVSENRRQDVFTITEGGRFAIVQMEQIYEVLLTQMSTSFTIEEWLTFGQSLEKSEYKRKDHDF